MAEQTQRVTVRGGCARPYGQHPMRTVRHIAPESGHIPKERIRAIFCYSPRGGHCFVPAAHSRGQVPERERMRSQRGTHSQKGHAVATHRCSPIHKGVRCARQVTVLVQRERAVVSFRNGERRTPQHDPRRRRAILFAPPLLIKPPNPLLST